MCRRWVTSSILAVLCLGAFTGASGQPPSPSFRPLKQTAGDFVKDAGPTYATVPPDTSRFSVLSRSPELDPRNRYPDTTPMPPLPIDEKAGAEGSCGRLVSKNLITGEVVEREDVTLSEILGRDLTVEQEEALRETVMESSDPDKHFIDWVRVNDPTTGDYPKRVRIWMRFIDVDGVPVNLACSGTLIDPLHVITAGHCIYSHSNEDEGIFIFDWADEVTVAPGYDDGVSPWGTADAEELHTWSGWKDDRNRAHDVAIVDLDRPVGILTGWYNVGQNQNCDYYKTYMWYHVGYPGWANPPCELMYTTSGLYDDCLFLAGAENQVWWDNSSGGGTSGSGAVRDGTVWAVHSAGNEYSSTDVILTPEKFSDIMFTLHEDWPQTPDLWPLQITAEPPYVAAGDTLGLVRVHDRQRRGAGLHGRCELLHLSLSGRCHHHRGPAVGLPERAGRPAGPGRPVARRRATDHPSEYGPGRVPPGCDHRYGGREPGQQRDTRSRPGHRQRKLSAARLHVIQCTGRCGPSACPRP